MSWYGYEYDDRRNEHGVNYEEAFEQLNGGEGVTFSDLLDTDDFKARLDEAVTKALSGNSDTIIGPAAYTVAGEMLAELAREAIQARLDFMIEEAQTP